MRLTRSFKILSLILVFFPVGGMVSLAFADCQSPCCGLKACNQMVEPTIPEKCHFLDVVIKGIRSSTCHMNRLPTVEGASEACLTVSRVGRLAPGVYAVLSYELKPLSTPFEGPVRRPLDLARAAPDPLYLQNLTLLI